MIVLFTKEDAEKLIGDHIVIPDGYTVIDVSAFEDRTDIKSIFFLKERQFGDNDESATLLVKEQKMA